MCLLHLDIYYFIKLSESLHILINENNFENIKLKRDIIYIKKTSFIHLNTFEEIERQNYLINEIFKYYLFNIKFISIFILRMFIFFFWSLKFFSKKIFFSCFKSSSGNVKRHVFFIHKQRGA